MKDLKKALAAIAVVALVGCSSSTASAKFKAGTYTGKGAGHNGDVVVEVTVSDSAITKVEIKEHQETDGISDNAIANLPGAIVEANSADVDTISGCTDTSNAIIEAIKAALDQAK